MITNDNKNEIRFNWNNDRFLVRERGTLNEFVTVREFTADELFDILSPHLEHNGQKPEMPGLVGGRRSHIFHRLNSLPSELRAAIDRALAPIGWTCKPGSVKLSTDQNVVRTILLADVQLELSAVPDVCDRYDCDELVARPFTNEDDVGYEAIYCEEHAAEAAREYEQSGGDQWQSEA